MFEGISSSRSVFRGRLLFTLLFGLGALPSTSRGPAGNRPVTVRAPAVLIGREPQAQPVHLDLTPSGFVARLPAAGPTTPLPRVQDAVAASDGSLYVLDGGRGVVYEFDR